MVSLNVAVSGCVHGNLDFLYNLIAENEIRTGQKCDLLLCTGDFQAIRDRIDLETLSCPEKYRQMGDFWKYYVGMTTAPVLTLLIGGNHESVGYMHEMQHGGWLAPNIFYLGEAGVIKLGSLRIAGLSGIYRRNDYSSPPVQPPFYAHTLKEAYAVKAHSVERLMQVTGEIDVLMTHDWPVKVAFKGNTQELIRRKPYLQRELRYFGNPFSEQISHKLHPTYWFASHMHIRWDAQLGDTVFRSMDKCLPNRECVSYVTLPGEIRGCEPVMDSTWASILTSNLIETDLKYPSFGMVDLTQTHSYLHSPSLRINPQVMLFP